MQQVREEEKKFKNIKTKAEFEKYVDDVTKEGTQLLQEMIDETLKRGYDCKIKLI